MTRGMANRRLRRLFDLEHLVGGRPGCCGHARRTSAHSTSCFAESLSRAHQLSTKIEDQICNGLIVTRAATLLNYRSSLSGQTLGLITGHDSTRLESHGCAEPTCRLFSRAVK